MPTCSDALAARAADEIAKDLFIVEIHSPATSWIAISKIQEVGHAGVRVLTPRDNPDQRIHLAVEEITAVRVTKAGDAAARGHSD